MSNPVTWRTLVLAAATFAMGLMAGLFFAYSVSVMPGLAGASDRTVVETMQRINVAIQNPAFGAAFAGSLVLTAIAAVAYVAAPERRALPWIVAGLVAYVAVLVVTFAVNIPLNDALAAAGAPERIADITAVRTDFEGPWVAWNLVRTAGSLAAFAALVVAMLVA